MFAINSNTFFLIFFNFAGKIRIINLMVPVVPVNFLGNNESLRSIITYTVCYFCMRLVSFGQENLANMLRAF